MNTNGAKWKFQFITQNEKNITIRYSCGFLSIYRRTNSHGDAPGDYNLYVQKGIRAEKVRVDIAEQNDWADYVFEEGYVLMPIEELEAFIKEHKHLPGVPSAAEVVKDGIDLAEMNKILLEKIEELTLRIIELEKAKR